MKRIIKLALFSLLLMSCISTNVELMRDEALTLYPMERPFVNSSFIEVNGTRLHLRHWNPDPVTIPEAKGTILLIHGVSGSSYNWRFIAPELADAGWKIISIDIPPFGFSGEIQETGYSMDPLKRDSLSRAELLWNTVDELIEEKNYPITILGHSLGGRIVVHMASLNPHRVDKLILLSPALYGSSAIPAFSKYWPFNTIVQGSSTTVMENKRIVEYVMNRAYGRKVTRDEFMGNWAPFLRPGVAEACGEWAISSIDSEEPPFKEINTETLILWSNKDKIVTNRGERLSHEMKQAQYIEIPGKSHCIMDTQGELVSSSIIDFLSK